LKKQTVKLSNMEVHDMASKSTPSSPKQQL